MIGPSDVESEPSLPPGSSISDQPVFIVVGFDRGAKFPEVAEAVAVGTERKDRGGCTVPLDFAEPSERTAGGAIGGGYTGHSDAEKPSTAPRP